jgi:hypothetical protein
MKIKDILSILPEKTFNLTPDNQQKIYDLFKKNYEAATGKSWSYDKFLSRAHGWMFYGEETGGIAVRMQRSGLIKLVAAFGSPRGVIQGMRELLDQKGNSPIWGAMDKRLAAHLKKLGFTSPPGLLLKILAPQIRKVMGDELKKVKLDGTLILNTEFGETEKVFIANKAYYDWLKRFKPFAR